MKQAPLLVIPATLILGCSTADDLTAVEVNSRPFTDFYVVSPFGPNDSVWAGLGNRADGKPWLFFSRASDSYCSAYQLSTTSYLTGDLDVTLSNADDGGRIVGSGESAYAYCSNMGGLITLSPLQQNGHVIYLHGGPGNDLFICNAGPNPPSLEQGGNNCYGDGGNDQILTSGNASLWGGDGDDTLVFYGPASNASSVQIYGQGGYDCLQTNSAVPSVYSCGTGSGKSTVTPGGGCSPVIASSCN
jgi:hypothetical protein